MGGTLREYQREGLAWLGFLREFGLGGVLADDMGLGKTVQVLALLRANRTPSKTTGLPSLVLAPRSLVYNWIDEAKRFTPTLKVVEYRGSGREAMREKFSDYDIIVTTYGTLRRDVDFLATVEFDTLVLDEAQAVKNRESLSAKACRLLQAQNRLALTGTPIENHLGELGSIFEILNPGLLGSLPRLEVLLSGRVASQEELKLVAEGIRPFILRRTKDQVLKDLPPKTEQILYCTLREEQQALYDKLRLAYQGKLLARSRAVSRATRFKYSRHSSGCARSRVIRDWSTPNGRARAAPSSTRSSIRSLRCSKRATRSSSSRNSPSSSAMCASSSTSRSQELRLSGRPDP